MSSKALKDVSVETVVVFNGKSVEELEEGSRQDQIAWVPNFERGHRQNLVHPEKHGILTRTIITFNLVNETILM